MEELKRREPDSKEAFHLLQLALREPQYFGRQALGDEKIQQHLFGRHRWRFIMPIYSEKDDVPSYEELTSMLPIEVVGSFLASPKRQNDLSRWGQALMKEACAVLQGTKGSPAQVEKTRSVVNRDVLQLWAEQNTTDFLELAVQFLKGLSRAPYYETVLRSLTDDVLCLLLRFRPETAMEYYHHWNAKAVWGSYRPDSTFLAQLWRVKDCNLPAHRQFRRSLLEETPNDDNIMCMTLAALAEGGEDELWQLATQEYLASNTAKERNLGVSILPWFGTKAAIALLKRLQSEDPSDWVRGHAKWAYEVAQQERSCRAVYREALQTRDLLRISAVFEPLKPALSPMALWWHHLIEEEELGDVTSDSDAKLHALLCQFWYRWSNALKSNPHREVFGRRLRDYCRGDKLQGSILPKIAPWWEPR